MAKTIGRVGYLGVGLESTPGTPVAATVFLPYTDISIRGHHEPIEVIGSNASRIVDRSSVAGKKWSEGDVQLDLDVVNSGYLFKMALGNEVLATGTPNSHTFFVTTSGNTPKTATFIYGQDTDVEQYDYVALDELTLEVSDGLATIKSSFLGDFPVSTTAQTVTMTSGTIFAFPNFSMKLGADLTAANSASATPVSKFKLTIKNNVEVIHQTGQATVTAIRSKGIQVTGGYQVFFDSTADRDAYYALNKRAMQITLTGNANESLRIRIPQFRLNEGEISTGIDDFFMIDTKFVAEDDIDLGTRLIDVLLQNSKATTY